MEESSDNVSATHCAKSGFVERAVSLAHRVHDWLGAAGMGNSPKKNPNPNPPDSKPNPNAKHNDQISESESPSPKRSVA